MAHRSFSHLLAATLVAAGLTLTAAVPGSGAPAEVPPDAAAAQAALDRAAGTRPGSVTGWYVDKGSLVVEVFGSADGVPEWAAANGAGTVRVDHLAERPRPFWDLIGGQTLHNGTYYRCTLGFNVRTGATHYVLTAGHCVRAVREWDGAGGYVGIGVAYSYPNDDYGVVQVVSGLATPTALVDRYSAGTDVTVTGVTNPSVGLPVCTSSPATGWQCAPIVSLNHTLCYGDGCVYQLARVNLCGVSGISGASVVTAPGSGNTVRAVGLVHGGVSCANGGWTMFQPVAEPLAAYGLTLVTG